MNLRLSSVLHEKNTHIKHRLRCDTSEMTEGVFQCARYTERCWWRSGRAQRKFLMLQLKGNILVCKRDFSIFLFIFFSFVFGVRLCARVCGEIWRISLTAIWLKKIKIWFDIVSKESLSKKKCRGICYWVLKRVQNSLTISFFLLQARDCRRKNQKSLYFQWEILYIEYVVYCNSYYYVVRT